MIFTKGELILCMSCSFSQEFVGLVGRVDKVRCLEKARPFVVKFMIGERYTYADFDGNDLKLLQYDTNKENIREFIYKERKFL